MTKEQAKQYIKDQLESYLTGLGIDISNTFTCLNPKHEDKHPSMSYDPKRKKAKCFSCGVDYDTLDIIGMQYGITGYPEKLDKGCQIFHINREGKEYIPSNTTRSLQKPSAPKQEEKPQADQSDYLEYVHSLISEIDYPQSRGLSQETVDHFKLGYDPAYKVGGGQQWKALIIPTSNASYTARNLAPTGDRYRNKGKSTIFNLEALNGMNPAFIVEGEIDAMSIYEVGGQAVGLGSTANFMQLVDYLKEAPPENPVLLALDKDRAGQETTEKLVIELEKQGIKYFKVDIAGDCKDPNQALLVDREAFTQRIIYETKEASLTPKERYKRTCAASSIESFINGIHENANTPSITTGFTKLDKVLDGGLYEGLYIVGAISSLGKTTLITQIGDQIAKSGKDVLLFSLEMAKTEIMAKSISRQTIINCNGDYRNAKTTRGVTDGARWKTYSKVETDLLYKAAVDYGSYATRIYIHEGMGNIGVDHIRRTVDSHIKFTGNSPVVIIDYLQILEPYEMKASDKQNTDKAVLELKLISRKYKIPVIGISSFNRQNYEEAVSMKSFKESGAIEYSSDVLIGLQLEGVGGKGFNVDEEKKRAPRKVQLKILKNRNGKSGDTISYEYFPAFNYFVEVK